MMVVMTMTIIMMLNNLLFTSNLSCIGGEFLDDYDYDNVMTTIMILTLVDLLVASNLRIACIYIQLMVLILMMVIQW